MVEKIMINESAKNHKIEENQRKFDLLFQREKEQEIQIQKHLKEEQEKKLHIEIGKAKEDELREKQEKKEQWMKFLDKLKLQ